MIIIKSQDGKIIPFSEQDMIEAESNSEIYMSHKYGEGYSTIFLGLYSTKERALEVMSEIEKLIRELKLIDVIKHTRDFIIDFDRMREFAIYSMPKE